MSNLRNEIRLSRKVVTQAVLMLTCSTITFGAEVTYLGAITETLHAPTSLYIDGDALAVLEPFKNELTLYTPDGRVQERVEISGRVNSLQRLSEGEYLFCDRKAGTVVSVNTIAHEQSTFLGAGSALDPTDILVNAEFIHILDANEKSLNTYNVLGNLVSSTTLLDSAGVTIDFPAALAYDNLTQRFFVLDQSSSEIWMLNSNAELINKFSTFGKGQGEITRGGALRCDNQGLLYVADRFQGRVVVFNTFGDFIANIELSDFVDERLNTPIGLTTDESSILYVASTESASIHMFKVNGYSGGSFALRVNQLYPLDGDTIAPETVMFSVESFAALETIKAGLFDFEIYTGNDTVQPTIVAIAVNPNDSLAGENGGVIGEWRPTELLEANTKYRWRSRLRTAEFTGPWSELHSFTVSALPREFALSQNYPNPFNPATKILFTLARDVHVTITVINLLGQRVVTLVDEELPVGDNQIIWDGTNSNSVPVASGVYFYRMKAAEFSASKKMVLIK